MPSGHLTLLEKPNQSINHLERGRDCGKIASLALWDLAESKPAGRQATGLSLDLATSVIASELQLALSRPTLAGRPAGVG